MEAGKRMELITHHKHARNLTDAERALSVIGGSILTIAGLKRWSASGFALALIGGEFLRRGLSGHSYVLETLGMRTAPKGQGAETTSVPYELGVRVDRSITINRPRADVFRFWRDLTNLSKFMSHVKSISIADDNRSHWVVTAPGNHRTVEWDAVIHNEIEDELIAWRTLPDAEVDHAGSVLFRDAPGQRGTEIRIELQYNPPGGMVGAVVAKLWGEEPTQQIEADLVRLKQILEAGEIPTVEGQPAGPATSRRPGAELGRKIA
jgi:uncharacterized membrane protein